MTLDELNIEFTITAENQIKIDFSYLADPVTHSKFLNLPELEEFQSRLAIAAAKLRGKFAKEVTGQ